MANDIKCIQDQEALVYLRSRGYDCNNQINALVRRWKKSEQSSPAEDRRRAGIAQGSDKPALSILELPEVLLKDFWDSAPPGDDTLEATLFRTVDWCEIGGFDQWWQRLARACQEKVLDGGIDSSAPYWLFNMVRSDYAIRLIPQVLEQCLGAISFSKPNQQPRDIPGNDCAHAAVEHVSHASAIVFARRRLPSVHVAPELVEQAVDAICRMENHGAWRAYTGDSEASIESTAMAVHALALAKPGGWQRLAANARDWLWSVQQNDGAWCEPGSGPVYLTVLVLDAIALANSETTVTFRLSTAQPGGVMPTPAGGPAISESGANLTEMLGAQPPVQPLELATGEQRRAAVDAYIQEVVDKTGKRITRTDIWKACGYSTRTEFERWERNDRRATGAAHRNFTRVLTEKPDLKQK